ncbi:homeotic protein ultrabithorax isoform X2 [Bemisia tabaci]|uniref:homeotic protein ultrabithorax isoform X2 n=1 Tax=Bemisia tabaci TaxID=7038 RepID=UPI003B27D401
MNSYFEQTGFYGGHHHQTAGSHHHDQAYRFPLGLGMSPYASTQHHHHGLQSRPQDSPYDASVAAAACKLYSSSADSQTSINYSTNKGECTKNSESGHQNGYAAAAAAVKDIWSSATANSGSGNSLVRPSACTPDSRTYGSSVGLVGGDPGSSPGATGSTRTSSSATLGSSWNTCSLNSTTAQSTQLHQQAANNHTFYPWMAIAGMTTFAVALICLIKNYAHTTTKKLLWLQGKVWICFFYLSYLPASFLDF